MSLEKITPEFMKTIGGDASQDDMETGQAIAQLCFLVADNDLAKQEMVLNHFCKKFPGVKRLFARCGVEFARARERKKH